MKFNCICEIVRISEAHADSWKRNATQGLLSKR